MPQSVLPTPRREIRDLARLLLRLDRHDRQHALPAFIRLVELSDEFEVPCPQGGSALDRPEASEG